MFNEGLVRDLLIPLRKVQLIEHLIDTLTDSDIRTRTSYRGVYEFRDGNNTYNAYSITGLGNVNRLLKEVDVEYEKS